MKTIVKYAAAAVLTGALALAATVPSQAQHRWHHNRGAVIGGFVAGAVIGAAAANANAAYEPGYAYEPDYAYEPEAGAVYVAPAPQRCWHPADSDRGYGYYGSCY